MKPRVVSPGDSITRTLSRGLWRYQSIGSVPYNNNRLLVDSAECMNVYGGRHSRCNYKVIIFPLAARPGEVTARIRISISWSDFCLFDTRINFVAITIRNYVNSAAHSLCAESILWCQTEPVCRTYGTSGPSTWFTPTRLRSYRHS